MLSVCDVYSAVLKCIASILNKMVIALSINNLFKTFAYVESHTFCCYLNSNTLSNEKNNCNSKWLLVHPLLIVYYQALLYPNLDTG